MSPQKNKNASNENQANDKECRFIKEQLFSDFCVSKREILDFKRVLTN